MFYTINFKRKKKAKNIYVNQQRAFWGGRLYVERL